MLLNILCSFICVTCSLRLKSPKMALNVFSCFIKFLHSLTTQRIILYSIPHHLFSPMGCSPHHVMLLKALGMPSVGGCRTQRPYRTLSEGLIAL